MSARSTRGAQRTAPTDGHPDVPPPPEETPNVAKAPSLDPRAALLAAKEFPEGRLSPEAQAAVRDALRALRPVQAAFRRYDGSVGRSTTSLCLALARAYAWAREIQGKPEILGAAFERNRIKVNKRIRENRFLGVLKLAHPHDAADSVSRWASALAFCAARGCLPEDISALLQEIGIREAADRWTELRAATRTPKKGPPKPTPLEIIQATCPAVGLPEDVPVGEAQGPFIIIAERQGKGAVAYCVVVDEALVTAAMRKATLGRGASTKSRETPI